MTAKGYAIKDSKGVLQCIAPTETAAWALFGGFLDGVSGFHCVPGYFYEGEPKAVAKVGRSDIWHMPTLEWLPESGAMHIPNGALLYANPPGTLALLRDAREALQWEEGGEPLSSLTRNVIERIEAALKEAE